MMMLQRRILLQGSRKFRYPAWSSSPRERRREITTYLRDVLRTGSLSPTNPLVDALKRTKTLDSDADKQTNAHVGKKGAANLCKVPDFSGIQPYHVAGAVQTVRQDYVDACAALHSDIDKASLQDLLQRMDALQASVNSLRQISSLLWLLSSDASQKAEWRFALNALNVFDSSSSPGDNVSLVEEDEILYSSLKSRMEGDQDSDGDLQWAAKDWIRTYEHRTGNHLSDKNREEYRMLESGMKGVEENFQNSSSSTRTSALQQKELLGDMYNFIGIRNRQAELLGYPNYAEQIMESHMATLDQVQTLHEKVAERVIPLLNVETGNTALDAYLSPSGPGPKQNQGPPGTKKRSDHATMIQLHEHVTLDGALFFLSRLSQDLFGVAVEEDGDSLNLGWHSDVRLFHLLDENNDKKHLGSFYLDPYKRTGKLDRALTSPLLARSTVGVPIVALSLAIEPPTWDTQSVPMTWDDVESLFHEYGHVFQFLIARSSMGALLGPQNMPFDLSEFLPKVRLRVSEERHTRL
jgi:Zn-dependent oligopeptidase